MFKTRAQLQAILDELRESLPRWKAEYLKEAAAEGEASTDESRGEELPSIFSRASPAWEMRLGRTWRPRMRSGSASRLTSSSGISASVYDRADPGRHGQLDRQVAHRVKALLPKGLQQPRGPVAVLRQPVSDGRGGLELLRHALVAKRCAVG